MIGTQYGSVSFRQQSTVDIAVTDGTYDDTSVEGTSS